MKMSKYCGSHIAVVEYVILCRWVSISPRFLRIVCLPRFFHLFRLATLREIRYAEGVREQGAEDNLWTNSQAVKGRGELHNKKIQTKIIREVK